MGMGCDHEHTLFRNPKTLMHLGLEAIHKAARHPYEIQADEGDLLSGLKHCCAGMDAVRYAKILPCGRSLPK